MIGDDLYLFFVKNIMSYSEEDSKIIITGLNIEEILPKVRRLLNKLTQRELEEEWD